MAPFTVSFYDPTIRAQDGEGRTLDEILNFSDRELEWHHDFIQYLFPLPERSPVNPYAPVLDKATRDAFLERPELRREVFRSIARMAKFYGFAVKVQDIEGEGDGQEGKVTVFMLPNKGDGGNWTPNSRLWLTRFSHNHLRITRIIRCLRVLGMPDLARGFHQILLFNDTKGVISDRTKMYWRRAAERGLHLAPEEDDDDAKGLSWLRGAGGEVEGGEGHGFDGESGRVAVLRREEVGGLG